MCSWEQIQIWKADCLPKGILRLFSRSALLCLDHSELNQRSLCTLTSGLTWLLMEMQEARYSWNVYPFDSPTTLTVASSWWLHLSTERESSCWVSFSTCCPSHVMVKNFLPLPRWPAGHFHPTIKKLAIFVLYKCFGIWERKCFSYSKAGQGKDIHQKARAERKKTIGQSY